MEQAKIEKLQEALNTVAEVCDQHVATAKEHRRIAEALNNITQTLSALIKEKLELSSKETE